MKTLRTLCFSLCLGATFMNSAQAKDPAFTASVNPGLSFLGGIVGPAVGSYVGIKPVQDLDLHVGGDFNLAFYFPGSFMMQLDILPSAWYEFNLGKASTIRPVVGLSFGPTILVGSGGGLAFSGVTYALYFRPGFLMRTGNNTHIGGDLKFGIVGGAFVFRPQANFVWEL
jgi:hypothetical protein